MGKTLKNRLFCELAQKAGYINLQYIVIFIRIDTLYIV